MLPVKFINIRKNEVLLLLVEKGQDNMVAMQSSTSGKFSSVTSGDGKRWLRYVSDSLNNIKFPKPQFLCGALSSDMKVFPL